MHRSNPRLAARIRILLPLPLLLVGAGLGVVGCAGNPSSDEGTKPEEGASPYVPLPPPERSSPGYFLTEIDVLMRAWSNRTLNARTDKDWELVRLLEKQMNQETWKHRQELIDFLTSGPPRSREVAAAALGFVREPEALSPLLNALSDPEPMVVEKALLGLGILADPSTPLAQILFQMQTNSTPRARVNAAYAVYRIVTAGGGDESVAAACQEGLRDEEWGVQTQCAGILGRVGDGSAVAGLGELLLAESSLACQSAAVALCRIAKREEAAQGPAARSMVDALPRMKATHHRLVLEQLQTLSGKDFGSDLALWRDWAYRLR